MRDMWVDVVAIALWEKYRKDSLKILIGDSNSL